MNQRIRLLAEQAKQYAINQLDETGELHRYYDVYFEKFAQLIVKETLEVARAGVEFGDGMEDAVYRYFGVKE